ncbi:MAG: GAF domain-containing sensor histidine kinase [Candidatus Cloacimonetes bacterium]|nr:GAF domain-containing sensor histidine kinase [Candidatus Cloacimonadota bacterium]
MDRWRQRELHITREIARAFLQASHPLEVYRIALARVTPLVDASFSSVFLRDPTDPGLLKLECAQNWPQSSARFLSQMRIREGRGPTGRAVSEQRAITASNVFDDPSLREWWEPARELGFSALVALPLESGEGVVGALSFYFEEPHEFHPEELHLLQLLADELAASAQRVQALDELRRENTTLRREMAALRGRIGEAEESKRLKDEFVANMSHELRTPLNSILGYAYLLLEGQTGKLEEPQQNAVEKIHRSANVLLHLINDLLDLSELKLGRAEIFIAPDDAVSIAHRAAESVGQSADNVSFSIESDAEEVPITTDGEKAVKILHNLISNAFKFTNEGSVTVRVRRVDDDPTPFVEWTVSDTGIGIPPGQLEAVFDEFRQVDGSSTRLYGGTGLGLALSRRLAELLGGRILVESELNEGSRFTLQLPATWQGSDD